MATKKKNNHALFARLAESDVRIRRVRRSFRTKRMKRVLIERIIAERRKGTTRKQRLFARSGGYAEVARNNALATIRKSKKGFTVKIGGDVKGVTFRFKTRSAAARAVNAHHDKFLKSRLGAKGFKRAKAVFSSR